MFPGMPKIDPKKMQALMKQMGIHQEEIPAEKVIIEKPDGKIIIINPSVQKVKMQGQETFQISGDVSEVVEKFSEQDVKLIMEKTGSSEKGARKVLEKTNGDIAEAIMKLSG